MASNLMNLNAPVLWLVATPLRIAVLVAAIVLIALAVYSNAEARSLRVTSDELVSETLPAEFDGVRLVFLADVHAGRFFGERSMRALVDAVNAQEPDILVLGGDYVGGRANGAATFYRWAPDFEARLAKLAVLGNHDVWEGEAEARAGLAASGFTALENAAARVSSSGGPGGGEASITIAGVDDLYTGNPDVARAASDIPAEDFAVLVSHNPDVFATQLDESVRTWDLALAGHTHAGQMTVLGFGAPIVPSRYGQRYRNGWMNEQGTPILVTNGVGVVTLPVRFFARPEIHVITLRRA